MQGYAYKSDTEPPVVESRAGLQLRSYMDGIRGARLFPTESEIDPDALHKIWDYCFLVSIDPVARHAGYRYSYLGQKLIEVCGDNLHNSDIAVHLISTTTTHLKANFDEVLRTQQAVIDENEFVNVKRLNVKYRVSLFPLGSDDNITHIIGCMRWRIY